MQNSYNNFLKRQKTTATNNFKEKVANSLSGKALNNTSMPNTTNSVANKLRSVSNVATQSPTIASNTPQTVNDTNAQQAITTPPVSQQTPQNTINEVAPVSEGTGLMSLSDVNDTISSKARAVDNSYKELLEQNKNAQIEQANKNWETQQQAHNQQVDALKGQYEQSKVDAENAYNDSVNKLNENRYNQIEDLNISGTNRGIQYSPQQLGLENVANINHNKNLAETSKTRNELLNKLQIEMNNSLAQLNLKFVEAQNEYNKNLLDINTNYNNTLLGWEREDAITQSNRDYEAQLLEDKRKYEEVQKLKDQEYEKLLLEEQRKYNEQQKLKDQEYEKLLLEEQRKYNEQQKLKDQEYEKLLEEERRKWEEKQTLQQQQYEQALKEAQNKWQSSENQLDRDLQTQLSKSRSVSNGYSSGYSNGYSSGYGGYSDYGTSSYGVSTASLSDDIEARAYQAVFNDVSDDAYNAYTSLTSPYNASSRASGYASEVDDMITYAKNNGASKETLNNLYNTRDKAMKQIFEDHSGIKNYGGDAIARGDAKVDFYKKNVMNSLDQKMAKQAETLMKQLKTPSKNTSSTSKTTTTKKAVTQTKNTKSTTTKKTASKAQDNKSKQNLKKNNNFLKKVKESVSKLFKKK